MKDITLHRLAYKTSDIENLITYKHAGVIKDLPVVYVYEYYGSKKQALERFMPLNSFAMAEVSDGRYIAFPINAISKVKNVFEKLLYRVENGKVIDIDNVCSICADRIRNVLSGCDKCESIKKVKQLYPMIIKNIKGKTVVINNAKKKRIYRSA
ncbi:MAG: hypothetical protein VST71_06555 [Nitrospirota bacterium]|nr:hypothetical protein [Nitrospirota bacterium]